MHYFRPLFCRLSIYFVRLSNKFGDADETFYLCSTKTKEMRIPFGVVRWNNPRSDGRSSGRYGTIGKSILLIPPLKTTIMEPKKDLKVNLELRKTTLVLVGLVAALAVLFITLEWSDSQTRKSNVMVRVANDEPEEVMIVTMQNLQTPPPPPPPAPDVIEQLEVVDDNVIIDEVDMLSMEDDDDVEVKIVNLDAAPSEGEEEADLNQTFVLVEEQPEFPGGESALMQYLRDHLRYPAFAQENGIQGRVVLSFIVERDGSIANIEAMRSPAEELTKESIRVVQSMPKWKPGKQRGKAVRVKYVLPVVFHLS